MTQGPSRQQQQTPTLRVQGVNTPNTGIQNLQFPESTQLPDQTSQKFDEVQAANDAAFEALAEANEATAQAEIADLATKGFDKGAQNLGAAMQKVAQTVNTITKRKEKRRALEEQAAQQLSKKRKKRAAEITKTAAKKRLQEEIINMRRTIREEGLEEGTQQFREQSRQVINEVRKKVDNPELVRELNDMVHQELDDVEQSRTQHAIQQMRNQKEKVEQIQTEKIRMQLSSDIARLEHTNDPEEAQKILDNVMQKAQQMAETRTDEPAAFNNVMLPLLKDIRDSATASADAQAQAREKIKRLNNYADEAEPVYQKYARGEITGNQLNRTIRKLGLKHGVPEVAGDVFKTRTEKLKEANDRIQTVQKSKELQTRDDSAIANEQAQDISTAQTARLALEYVNGNEEVRRAIEMASRKEDAGAFPDYLKGTIKDLQNDHEEFKRLQEDLWNTAAEIEEKTGVNLKNIIGGGEGGDDLQPTPVYDESTQRIILPRISEQVRKKAQQTDGFTTRQAEEALRLLKNKRKSILKEMAQKRAKWERMGGINVADLTDTSGLEEKEAELKPLLETVQSTPSSPDRQAMSDTGVPNPNKGRSYQPQTPETASLATDNGVKLPFQKKFEGKTRITSRYGPRENPDGTGQELHNGVDIAAQKGTPVSAIQGGRVLAVKDNIPGFGRTVLIKTPDGHTEQFSHLGKATVQVGQRVAPGQSVGTVGTSGSGTGPHLHFQVWRGDPVWGSGKNIRETQHANTFDPERYLNLNRQTQAEPRSNGPPSNQTMPGGDVAKDQPAPKSQLPIHMQRNVAKPYKRDKAPRQRQYYEAKTDLNSNHGYSALRDDPEFAKKLNHTANQLGIPGQWLADIVAFNTGGSFNSQTQDVDSPNKGLPQLTDATAKRVTGESKGMLNRNRHEQMDVLRKYLEQQPVRKMKDLDDVFAAMWGGEKAAQMDKKKRAKLNDGKRTFNQYLKLLGNHVGRRYHTPDERGTRNRQRIHREQVEGCQVCNQMLNKNGAVVPHYAD